MQKVAKKRHGVANTTHGIEDILRELFHAQNESKKDIVQSQATRPAEAAPLGPTSKMEMVSDKR
jgi:hypothetical protein